MGEWQPIETAPKVDGMRILGYGAIGFENKPIVGTVRWHPYCKCWVADPNEATEYSPEECKLTHWMPLPAPPSK